MSAANPMFPPARIDPAQTRLAQVLQLYPRPDHVLSGVHLFTCRFDPTGRFAFAGAQDCTIHRVELATIQKARLLAGASMVGLGTSAAAQPRYSMIATAAADPARTTLVGHKTWPQCLAFLPGGKVLFSGDYSGRVLAWPADAERPVPLRSIEANHGCVRALAVSPDGELLASCGDDGLVKLWSGGDGKPVQTLAGHASPVYNLAFHPGGRHLASADFKGVVKDWDLESGKSVRELNAPQLHTVIPGVGFAIGGVRGMAFDPKGSLLACSGVTGADPNGMGSGIPIVVLFDWENGTQKQDLVPDTYNGNRTGYVHLRGLVLHPSGVLAGVTNRNEPNVAGGVLYFWKPEAQMPEAKAPGAHKPAAQKPVMQKSFFTLALPVAPDDIALHPDGKRLAIAFFDGAIRIYDMSPKT